MKEAVVIKSFPNGIALYLNAELPFETLLEEIGHKFSAARDFFGSVTMAMSLEGRPVTDLEELEILEAIRQNSSLNISCIVEKGGEADEIFVRALDRAEQERRQRPEGQFFRGDLEEGETLETENSVIVLGSVRPGAAVVSAKDILVLGGLYGRAHAGAGGREAFVIAFEMAPEKLRIGDFRYKSDIGQPKWRFIKPKVQPKIAYIRDDRVVVEAYTKDLLSRF